jgi:hypothetical protein
MDEDELKGRWVSAVDWAQRTNEWVARQLGDPDAVIIVLAVSAAMAGRILGRDREKLLDLVGSMYDQLGLIEKPPA